MGFIRKFCLLEDVPQVLENYLSEYLPSKQGGNSQLVLHLPDGILNIPLDSILYIEGAGKNQLIHVTNSADPISCRLLMQDLEEKLSPSGFLRAHKGYLVNYRFIRRIDDTDIILTKQERVPVSRRKLQEIRDEYLKLVKKTSVIF